MWVLLGLEGEATGKTRALSKGPQAPPTFTVTAITRNGYFYDLSTWGAGRRQPPAETCT